MIGEDGKCKNYRSMGLIRLETLQREREREREREIQRYIGR